MTDQPLRPLLGYQTRTIPGAMLLVSLETASTMAEILALSGTILPVSMTAGQARELASALLKGADATEERERRDAGSA